MRVFQGVWCSTRFTFICMWLVILFSFLAVPLFLSVNAQVSVEHTRPQPPLYENGTHKTFAWGNDVTVATGTVEGGISLASDTSGNLYAARCSTDVSTTIFIYKSTDAGASWSHHTQTNASSGSLLHPVLLTGSSGDKLYLFYIRSSLNGSIVLLRYAPNGTFDGNFEVKVDSDTITYFSACTDLGTGDHLMVVFERQKMGDATPDLYSIVSTDQGETWSSEALVTGVGSHPDIAYGNDGYLYCVHEKTGGPDKEIGFVRSSDYGISWDAGTGEYLTVDSYDDTYPKVAALHDALPAAVHVWVVYNHDWGDDNIDLYYTHSSNAGVDWSENLPLANSADWDEMACDLWAKPDDVGYNVMSACYLRYKSVIFPTFEEWSEVHRAYVFNSFPTTWYSGGQVSDNTAAVSEDGREVCQGAYTKNQVCAIYAGKPSSGNFEGLYFDNGAWSDVEDETAEETTIQGFSLSHNYPNPFNPVTSIEYSISNRQTPMHTTLRIYNIQGQLVRTLVDEPQKAGTHRVSWDGRDNAGRQVASGVYLYRLEAGDFSKSEKMVLIR
jgi:hypothetical protein